MNSNINELNEATYEMDLSSPLTEESSTSVQEILDSGIP